MEPTIERIVSRDVAIPLKEPFKTALRTVTTAETVLVAIYLSNGEVGYGEAAPTPVITGDSKASIHYIIDDLIGPKLIGMSLSNSEAIKQLIDTAAVHNSSPKAALNIAINDLLAKQYQAPLSEVLGGFRQQVVTDYTVSVGTSTEMISHAKRLISQGFHTLKVKVGSDSEQHDLQKVRELREAVGPEIKIRLDANQGWHPKQAVTAIQAMEAEKLAVELVEQPVAASDFEGMAYVTQRVNTPILADESIFSVADADRLIHMGGCDLINLKLMKAGGIDNALKINTLAEAAGISCMVGSMIESVVSVTAAAHLAAAKSNIKYVDLDASMMFSENPMAGGIKTVGELITLPKANGLGITEK